MAKLPRPVIFVSKIVSPHLDIHVLHLHRHLHLDPSQASHPLHQQLLDLVTWGQNEPKPGTQARLTDCCQHKSTKDTAGQFASKPKTWNQATYKKALSWPRIELQNCWSCFNEMDFQASQSALPQQNIFLRFFRAPYRQTIEICKIHIFWRQISFEI